MARASDLPANCWMPVKALLNRSAPVAVPDWEKSADAGCELTNGAPYAEYPWTAPALPVFKIQIANISEYCPKP